jgi:DNA-directed RNA polymerase specialized sigma24 family protein
LADLEQALATHKKNPSHDTKAVLWNEVYSLYHDRLRDKDLASDATILAMNGMTTYDPLLGALDKWLANIAANLRKDIKRKNRDVQVEPHELEQLQLLVAPTGIKLDLSIIRDPQTRMLMEDVAAGWTIGEASARCGLTRAAAYKRLARLSKNISKECLIR